MDIAQYHMVMVDLGRVFVVVSPDEMNRYLQTIVVDQITTIDRKRVKRNLGKLSHTEIKNLKHVIRETYVD